MKKFYNVMDVEAILDTRKEAIDKKYRDAKQGIADLGDYIAEIQAEMMHYNEKPATKLVTEMLKTLEDALTVANHDWDRHKRDMNSAEEAKFQFNIATRDIKLLEQHSFDSSDCYEVTTPWESEFAVPEHEDTLELFIYVQPDEEYTNSIHDNAEAAYENYTRTITLTKGRLINAWQDYEHSYISITNVERRKLMWDTLKQIHKSYVTGKKVKHEGTFYYKPDGYRRINIVLDNGVNTIPDWARQAATEIIGEDDGSCQCEQVQAGATAGTCTCVHCGRVFGSWSDWNAYTRYERDQEIK